MPCPFQTGERFELDGEMVTVDCIYTYSGEVSIRTGSGRTKDVPYLDAVRAYRAFCQKEELNEECSRLQEQIGSLRDEWEKRNRVLTEMNTVWNVFRHFPAIKEFVMEIGELLKRSVHKVQLADVVEAFREKVLGIREPQQERTVSRVR